MSVRKRKWITQGIEREAWVCAYTDSTGKRRLKTFAKKKDADAFAASSKVEVSQGLHVPDSDTVTVEEAGKLWLKSGAAANLERTTLDQRRQHLDLHLNPFVGRVKLNKISGPSIRDLQDKLREAGRSPAMVRRVTVSLGSILADAQSRGLVIRNAVHEVSRARTSRPASETRAKARLRVGVDIPTNDEVKALLRAAAGRYRPLLVTAIFTGMRASELRGLKWDDVDFPKGEVHVRQRADRYQNLGMPKTDAGHRTIPLPPMVVNTLKTWKLSTPKGELGLVFPNTAGKVEFHQNMLQRGLWPAWIAAGVVVPSDKLDEDGGPIMAPKYPGFHALRHWYASWCINRKSDGGLELTAKAVQQRLGHSTIGVTLDTYSHLFPAVDEQAEMAAAERHLLGGVITS